MPWYFVALIALVLGLVIGAIVVLWWLKPWKIWENF